MTWLMQIEVNLTWLLQRSVTYRRYKFLLAVLRISVG